MANEANGSDLLRLINEYMRADGLRFTDAYAKAYKELCNDVSNK
jgi:hypothetical protein